MLYRVQILAHGKGPWLSFLQGVYAHNYNGDPNMRWLSTRGWGSNPNNVYVGGRFFFTDAGMKAFMKLTFPCLGTPFNVRTVTLEETSVPSGISIAYRDQYQVCLATASKEVFNQLLRLIEERE